MTMYNVAVLCNPDKLEVLKAAYNEIGITGMTVTRAEGCGTQKGMHGFYRGSEVDVSLLPKIKVEVVVSEIPWEKVVDTAKSVLKSEKIGSGKIFVYEVAHVIRVRTDEMDEDALKATPE